MRQAPVFTLTAVLTPAIGIGATTAIFTLVHAIMLKSLPVADPAQLYRIGDTQIEGQPVTLIGIAPPGFFGDTLRDNPPDFWLPDSDTQPV
jgi:hypothetical protein